MLHLIYDKVQINDYSCQHSIDDYRRGDTLGSDAFISMGNRPVVVNKLIIDTRIKCVYAKYASSSKNASVTLKSTSKKKDKMKYEDEKH